jgi:Uma2 family endonuclease
MATVAAADPTPQELRAALSNLDALYEVVNGRIVEVPAMSAYASRIAGRLRDAIQGVVRPAGLGFVEIESMFILDRDAGLRRRPDVAFVSTDRWPLDRDLPTSGDFDVVPDIVIEVLSPNDLGSAIAEKIREYFRHEVRQVWIVQPATRDVSVYRSTKRIEVFEDADVLVAEDILPGLRVPLTDLFSRAIV